MLDKIEDWIVAISEEYLCVFVSLVQFYHIGWKRKQILKADGNLPLEGLRLLFLFAKIAIHIMTVVSFYGGNDYEENR